MSSSRDQPIDTSARRRIAVLAAALIVIACGTVALRDAILGRGPELWWGYPLGFAIQLFFGMIALWAALQIWPRLPVGGFWMSLPRVAAMHAAFDALHPLAREHPLTGAAAQAVATIGLFLLLFPARGFPGAGAAVILYFMKVVTAMMVMETLFTAM
jgi:hypothetical protein